MSGRNIDWEKARCRDVDNANAFHVDDRPDDDDADQDLDRERITFAAKTICNNAPCPILEECREYAIANRLHGVWGGTTTRERNKIMKQRRKEAAA